MESVDVQQNQKLTITEASGISAAVLTAIAIPVFTTQLEKSRDATDQANIRSAYAELSAALITNTTEAEVATELAKSKNFAWTCTAGASGTAGTYTAEIAGKGTNNAWDNLPATETFKIGVTGVTAVGSFKKAAFAVDANGQVTGVTLSTT